MRRRKLSDRELFPILGDQYIKFIPWPMIEPHKGQADRNHGQTLGRLAERGGLSPMEAVCIMRDEPYPTARNEWVNEKARITLMIMVLAWEEKQP
jgi:hypothetical protein